MKSSPQFVHLRVQSKYSILESNIDIQKIADACKHFSMPAVALADANNLFGALEFSQTMVAEGVQPIQGLQVLLKIKENAYNPNDPNTTAPIVLLAQNEDGYKKLLRMNSLLYLETEHNTPQLEIEKLQGLTDGLICLTGGSEGPIGSMLINQSYDDALTFCQKLQELFPGRIYQEIQRHYFKGSLCTNNQDATEAGIIDIAYEIGVPLVATNNVQFMSKDVYEAVDMLYYIKNGGYKTHDDNKRLLTPQHYFKSQEEMAELFGDLPEAIENTVEIARRCSFHAQTSKPMLPVFCDNENNELNKRARAGLKKRLEQIELAKTEEEYLQRLEYELDVIKQINFAGYFLIVADFVNKAKEISVPVGPGRGSGAGSLVAYVLNITNLDPLRYSLLFERFLNTERSSVPDFDIDFCPEGREKVIDYVKEKYGADRVAQIVTFGSLGAKNAIRDFGRIMRIPRYQLNSWSAEIDPRHSFKSQRRNIDVLRKAENEDSKIKQMFDQIEQIEGIPRNTSRHAGGVVISNQPLEQVVPLYSDSKQELPVTQFDLKWVEKAGLVKMDFLGLKTLTVINKTLELIRKQHNELDINSIPLDDSKTFELYSSGQTVGVFQVEGQGMANTLKMMKPNKIEDIIALVALYRPGPMDNIPSYCKVKNGEKKREKLDPLIDHILEETNGIIVYQEQVMEIVKQMGGYSLSQADIVRRSMGKKIREDMDREKPIFIKGALAKGAKEKNAIKVWNLLQKFADYGFNKSHAAVYALVSYQTAYLKAHYPIEFMAAVMTEDLNDSVKIANYHRDINKSDFKLLPPDINVSGAEFGVKKGEITYSLAAIKSVGVDIAKAIEKARGDKVFKNIFDFANRFDMMAMSRSAFENLTRSGAFDSLDRNRKKLLENYQLLQAYSKSVRSEEFNQPSLFGDIVSIPLPVLKDCEDWSENERLAEELSAIGFFLNDHPVNKHREILKSNGIVPISEIQEWKNNFNGETKEKKKQAKIAGILTKVNRRNSSTGKSMAILSLSDQSGEIEVFMFPDSYGKSTNTKEENTIVVAHLEAKPYNGQLSVSSYKTYPIEDLFNSETYQVQIHFEDPKVPQLVKNILEQQTPTLQDGRKAQIIFCPFAKSLRGQVKIQIKELYNVNEKVQQALKGLNGVVEVKKI